MNIPNALTMARILAIPALVATMLARYSGHEAVALAIFVAATLTDAVDGWIARKKGAVTVLGQLLDPTADKLLIASALICLVELGLIPASAAIIIIGREIAVTGFRAMASSRGINIPASAFGKAKMGSESWVLGAFVLGPNYLGRIAMGAAKIGLWLVVALAIVSMVEYFIRFGPRVISPQAE
ncbi:MAG TPA: CDP-diacylglycerol--glycerol-3-phosphate 3-phosphatidyltransferase [Candidatus Aminicenantes bacterium]|nr:CDP-diacylglycerol--glycerol-3-phosphate 3-phosphatidyltransferase [Candidatus Aminicenantes bacterium]